MMTDIRRYFSKVVLLFLVEFDRSCL